MADKKKKEKKEVVVGTLDITNFNGVEKYIPGTKIVSREFRVKYPDKLKEEEK